MENSRLKTSMQNLDVGILSFNKSYLLSCVTGVLAVQGTEPLSEETGCLPCNSPIGVDVVDSIGAAQLAKSSRMYQVNFVCPVVGLGRG